MKRFYCLLSDGFDHNCLAGFDIKAELSVFDTDAGNKAVAVCRDLKNLSSCERYVRDVPFTAFSVFRICLYLIICGTFSLRFKQK